jgi:redox-sensitive bicupin YhaK (pirin superfamily)
MIAVQPFDRLGRFQNEWLNARHHFSFGHYRDASRMGAGGLVVWNDDEIAPGTGFDPHPHRDMEIVTYVRAGAITHRDGLGNEGRTEAGDVQVMHAGTGITHAEYNEESVPTRLFQIWIQPSRRGVAPGWGTRSFPKGEATEGALVALADGRAEADGTALPLYADAAVLAGTVRAGQTVRHTLGAGRVGYLVPSTGTVTVNGVAVNTRDGATITGEDSVVITATDDAELVLVDVAA